MLAIISDDFLDHASLDKIFNTYTYMCACSFSTIYQMTNTLRPKYLEDTQVRLLSTEN